MTLSTSLLEKLQGYHVNIYANMLGWPEWKSPVSSNTDRVKAVDIPHQNPFSLIVPAFDLFNSLR